MTSDLLRAASMIASKSPGWPVSGTAAFSMVRTRMESASVMITSRAMLAEQTGDNLIGHLTEVLIPQADASERFDQVRADQRIDQRFEAVSGFGGGHWYGHHHRRGAHVTRRADGRQHGGASGQTVIDQNGGAPGQVGHGSRAPVGLAATLQLGFFPTPDRRDLLVSDAQ